MKIEKIRNIVRATCEVSDMIKSILDACRMVLEAKREAEEKSESDTLPQQYAEGGDSKVFFSLSLLCSRKLTTFGFYLSTNKVPQSKNMQSVKFNLMPLADKDGFQAIIPRSHDSIVAMGMEARGSFNSDMRGDRLENIVGHGAKEIPGSPASVVIVGKVMSPKGTQPSAEAAVKNLREFQRINKISADDIAIELYNIMREFQAHTIEMGCDMLANQMRLFGYGAVHLGKTPISGKPDYVRVCCASNLWAISDETKSKMIHPMKLEDDTCEKLTIEVRAPNVLMMIRGTMRGSTRAHYYDLETGYMRTHADSCNNDGDVGAQKVSWAFEKPK